MKKVFICFLIILFLPNFFVLADDLAEDDFEENLPNIEYFLETSASTSSEPIVNSKNIVAIDRKTLSILYEKNCNEKVAMASTTKIMTCILALENCSLTDSITVSKNASSVRGSTLGLSKDSKISLNDLLYGLMLRSGNDCAIAIAEHISGSLENFSVLMNQKAQNLGLCNTHFTSPHGLDDEKHYTTAYELAILTDYALKNEKFREIVSTKNCTITLNGHLQNISNTNELLGSLQGVYGVKTGFTFNAGRCLVSACKRGDLDIIVVVLGADTKSFRTKDSINIINYIFNNYNYVDVSLSIKKSFENYYSNYFKNNCLLEKTTTLPNLQLEDLQNYSFPFSKNEELNLKSKIYIPNKFSYKNEPNSKVGILELYNNDKLICTDNIILKNELIKNTWKYYFRNIWESFKF